MHKAVTLPQCDAASAEHITRELLCPDYVPVPGLGPAGDGTSDTATAWSPASQAGREQGSRMAQSRMETGERSQGGLRENLSASPLPKNREGSQRWIRLKAGPGGWVRSQPAETSRDASHPSQQPPPGSTGISRGQAYHPV